MTARLAINLVPRSQWGQNLAHLLKGPRWDALRREAYRRAGYVCEICGDVGQGHPVEAHEDWEYDETAGVQRLLRLIALCPACHEVQHFGRAQAIGRGAQALAHLMKVNGWDEGTARAHVAEAFETWRRRNRIIWTLDLDARP